MGQILFGITLLLMLIYYPEVFLLAGLILAGFYFYGKYDLVERDKTDTDEVEEEPTMQERMEKEVESKMKPGFRDDPEWKAASKKLNDQSTLMRIIADLEMDIEDLEIELEKDCDPITANMLARAKKELKTLENQAGITQKREERTKEEKKPPKKSLHPEESPQTTPRDLTDQEIDAALQQLND